MRTLLKVPLYTATARLQIDRNVAKIVNTEGVLPVENGDYDFLRTQYELLKSRNMAEKVVSSLTLGDDPDLLKPRELSLLGLVTGLFSATPDRSAIDGSAASGAAVGVVMGNLGGSAGDGLQPGGPDLYRHLPRASSAHRQCLCRCFYVCQLG